ncbi:MAG TPA: hypothetical protein VLL96_06685 [Candidatus Deferrimicrobiaceae bacterium]|nr:hypothetical protein [Candidatus Deferrimicrobiaceae bacterium]
MIATNKITAYATIAVYDKNGKLVTESSTKKQEEEKPIPVRIEWSFKDYPNDNALDLCKTLHAEIQSMLNEAKFFYCK